MIPTAFQSNSDHQKMYLKKQRKYKNLSKKITTNPQNAVVKDTKTLKAKNKADSNKESAFLI